MKLALAYFFALLAAAALAQVRPADREARVDAQGVLRWQDTGGEVALMGVNLYTPFTADYRGLLELGADHKAAIRQDVAHLRRLGLGVIRVHCFDREISDAHGNLTDNIHLELLDDLIAVCRDNGIYTVLTPICWWDYKLGKTHGFSNNYTMQELTTNRTAWDIQARFLRQFAAHVNRRTGRRYGDDPCVLAFECINEPLYPDGTPDATVTDYINTLADALREATPKPIYYNSWHGRNRAAAAARINGVTGVSYPTGLLNGRALTRPQLHRVAPSSLAPIPEIARLSRMIYEFDAADVEASYMYPAMAKAFRAEGVQVAAMFQYDLALLAGRNANWQTHHLNLLYTPGKALSLAIAAEVFRHVPRGTPFTRPDRGSGVWLDFPPFDITTEGNGHSVCATPTAFIHSAPMGYWDYPLIDPERLERVWGVGSSPAVEYGGSGAYFLDRITNGLWRLQVFPDVFPLEDPYTGSPNPKALLIPSAHPFRVRLPDLGDAPVILRPDGTPADPGALPPGDYIIAKATPPKLPALPPLPMHLPAIPPVERPLIYGTLPEQVTIPGTPERITVHLHNPGNATPRIRFQPEGRPTPIFADIEKREAAGLPSTCTFTYLPPLPLGTYHARFELGDARYPPAGAPPFRLTVLHPDQPWPLLDPARAISAPWGTAGLKREAGTDDGRPTLRFSVPQGFSAALDCATERFDVIAPLSVVRRKVPDPFLCITLRARALHPATTAFELVIMQDDGAPFGTDVPLTAEWKEHRIPLHTLRYFAHWQPLPPGAPTPSPDPTRIDKLSLCFGRWLFPGRAAEPHAFEIGAIAIE
ncbi:MAG: glycoside hydrolase family 5 protein [Kiritimatiellaeota bacterium]|nr:glycoside hydrolase family 5 protein [Kiritimatiellota bacterium]